MLISEADSNDHTYLTELIIQSKAHWGYSQEQINAWLEELTITPEYIEKNEVFKLVVDSQIVGCYSYDKTHRVEVLLDNLFISPKFIGTGLGRLLLVDFLTRVKSKGFKRVLLFSDPHSEQFYAHFGFVVIGQEETSIEGRFLPIMHKTLD